MKLSELSSLFLFSFIPCILGVMPEWLREDPVGDPEVVQLFQDFIQTYGKVYADEEEFRKRFHIFRANLNNIEQLRESERGTAEYGITQFSDLTDTEMKRHLGFTPQQTTRELPQAEIPDIPLPHHFDWRAHNVVSSVKDQGECGSCWAFSAIGNMEGQWALKRGELFNLSVQELIDCDKTDAGCLGGYMMDAFEGVIKLGGLETQEDYPYRGRKGYCHFNETEVKVRIDSLVELPKDEMKIAKWLVKNGPVSASLNSRPVLQYHKGILNPTECNPEALDHAVLIVGFGVEYSNSTNEEIPYWIVKNSWGEGWGEKGYFRLYRGNNTCGIDSDVSSAVVNK